MTDHQAIRDYARTALEDRVQGGDGFYHTLLDFIAAVTKMDRRIIDVNIIRLADVDLNKLRREGL